MFASSVRLASDSELTERSLMKSGRGPFVVGLVVGVGVGLVEDVLSLILDEEEDDGVEVVEDVEDANMDMAAFILSLTDLDIS